MVRQFLKYKGVNQEFTHVATLEENAYIEALNNNIQREVVECYEFESIYHAQMILPVITTGITITKSMEHWEENHLNSSCNNLIKDPYPIKLKKTPILPQILNPFCP